MNSNKPRIVHVALLFQLALLSVGCVRSHEVLDDTPSVFEKIPATLRQQVSGGSVHDVLVELADPSDASDADDAGVSSATDNVLGDPTGPSSGITAVDAQVQARALRYLQLQEAILDSLDPSDVELRLQYEHVPYLFVRVHTLAGLLALAARPEVKALHEERQLAHQLAESLPLIHQPSVAASGQTGLGTAVAVLDTGCDYTRSDFGACKTAGATDCKVAYAADLAPSDNVLDDNGHGTNVAAIVLGVAPKTKVLALDVFSGETAPSSAVLAAIDWTIKNRSTYNIVALNLSLGSGQFTAQCGSDLFASALANARAAGIAPVVASGNDGSASGLASPACTPAAISVGAVYDANVGGVTYGNCRDSTTAADKVACFSNSASFLSLLAPGALIKAGGYTMAGTSQASPHVAGAVAVMRAAFPSESLNTSIARLTDNGPAVVDARNKVSKRRLDLLAALNSVPGDVTGPTGSVTINAAAALTNSSAVTLHITGSDPSGVATMCVSNMTTCTAFEPFATSKAWTLLAGDGDKSVRVTLKDGANNVTVVTAAVRLDTTAPAGATLRAVAADRQVALTWSAATDAGGSVSYRVYVAPNTAPACAGGTLVYTGTAASFTHTALQNGSLYGYHVCPFDGAGNVGAGSVASARPAPEFAPPTGSVSINAGALFAKSAAVTLTLAATDASGLGGMCISNSTSCTAWEAFNTSRAWSLAASSGAAKVYVWFKDKYENVTTSPVSATITVDTTVPTGGTFSAVAGVKQVALSWTAATDVSGIDAYRLVYAAGSSAPPSCASGSLVYTGSALSFTHTGLSSGAVASYRLCAYDKAGNGTGGLTRTVSAR